jgi:2,3-dihydroxybenzoate decarboxylase
MPAINASPSYKRIATEEAWCPPALFELFLTELREKTVDEPGFHSLWGFFAGNSERGRNLARRIQTAGDERLRDMDAAGIDMQILSLTAPGVQLFDPVEASAMARDYNDQLAEEIAGAPDRYAGLAAFSPLDSANAAKELERGVKELGLKGGILNGHVRGTYLDDPQYWDVFEAAESLDVPIYLHPNMLPKDMVQPFLKRGLDAAVYGFACDTGLHALRLVVSGLFDRFPKLQIILGHCGEALPFWLYRITYMHSHISRTGRYEHVQPLKKPAKDYLRGNFIYTNSGVADAPPIIFLRDVIGPERVMFAMDYPWQYEPEEVPILDALPLDEPGKKQFFEDNARRVFKL